MATADGSHILNPYGGVNWSQVGPGIAPVYIVLSGAAGDRLRLTLLGRAPAMAINISSAVDHMIHKALSGNYLITEFGHKPVSITIQGLDLYDMHCALKRGDNSSTIQEFYDRFNIHANKKARVDVGFAATSGNKESATAYRCVVLALNKRVSQDMSNKAPGVGEYDLSMIGVQLG